MSSSDFRAVTFPPRASDDPLLVQMPLWRRKLKLAQDALCRVFSVGKVDTLNEHLAHYALDQLHRATEWIAEARHAIIDLDNGQSLADEQAEALKDVLNDPLFQAHAAEHARKGGA